MLRADTIDLPPSDVVDITFQTSKDNLLSNKKEEEILFEDKKTKMEELQKKHKEGSSEDLKMKQYITECCNIAEKKLYENYEDWEMDNCQKDHRDRIVICRISLDDYFKYEDLFPRKSFYESGFAYIKAMLPEAIHESVTSQTLFFFYSLFMKTMVSVGQKGCMISDHQFKGADGALTPRFRHTKPSSRNNWSYPTFVFEIADGNESINDLTLEIMEWISDYSEVTIAVGLKLLLHKNGYRIVFVLAMKGDKEPRVIEIGKLDERSKPIDWSCLPVIPLPVSLLYDKAPVPSVFENVANVYLNLQEFSQHLLYELDQTWTTKAIV